jgi:hypothetical protein
MSPTLVIADYPVGFASGFGETLFNLFDGFQAEDLWCAHPKKNVPVVNKRRGQSVELPSAQRPAAIPSSLSLGYYPFLKAQQFAARRTSILRLSKFVTEKSIRNLLVIPVSPWILSVALGVHRRHPDLKLVFYVMDDWQGHHESFGLPFSMKRQRLLKEVIERATIRFAVSVEMARHYQDYYGHEWSVAHNGIDLPSVTTSNGHPTSAKTVLLAGDVNVFRFDAVLAFGQAIDRHNRRNHNRVSFSILGDVAAEYREQLEGLEGILLSGRTSHELCLEAMKAADLLYLPLAFDKRASRISLYSLPTKLPEYLATGHPVFFHAPRPSALYQVAERYDLTPRLATTDPKELDNFIGEWTAERHPDPSVCDKARKALSQEFDKQKLALKFQSAFA